MREIEYRAWLKKEKKMVEVREINFASEQISFETKDNILFASFDEIELIQYTNLKDKNGVKIFEGDIVKGDDKNLWEVRYDNETCRFHLVDKEDFEYVLASWCVHRVKVISNIYENPELMEVE